MYVCQSVHCLTSLLKLFQQWIYPVLDDLSFTYFLETFLICQYNSFYEFLYTGLKLLHSFCLSVSLFVTSLDSDGLSLATGDFLLVSGVNFETSGLVLYGMLLFVSLFSSWLYAIYIIYMLWGELESYNCRIFPLQNFDNFICTGFS